MKVGGLVSLVLFSAILSQVSAIPALVPALPANKPKCDKLSKYSFGWFIANTKPEYKGKTFENALFYSEGLSFEARKYAASHNLVTIWDIWPSTLYWTRQTSSNPLRCIMVNDAPIYFSHMSRAFAQMSEGKVTVLHKNINDIPRYGLWSTVERTVLQRRTGKVDEIEAIQADGEALPRTWRRGENVVVNVKRGDADGSLSRRKSKTSKPDNKPKGTQNLKQATTGSDKPTASNRVTKAEEFTLADIELTMKKMDYIW